MSTYLPKEIQDGLDMARKRDLARKSRLRIEAGDETFRVLRIWDNGFALDADHAPHLRGLVDIYDGARHLYQCLIVASEEDAGELRFEYKRSTLAADRAPLDFDRPEDAPVALLPSEG